MSSALHAYSFSGHEEAQALALRAGQHSARNAWSKLLRRTAGASSPGEDHALDDLPDPVVASLIEQLQAVLAQRSQMNASVEAA